MRKRYLNIILACFFFLPIYSIYGQGSNKFYQNRKFWRDINGGLWIGLQSDGQQAKGYNMIYTAPSFYTRFSNIIPRFYIASNMAWGVRFRGPILHKSLTESEFHKSTYTYHGNQLCISAGYYIKHLFLNKGTYGIALGMDYNFLGAYDISLTKLATFSSNGEPILIQKYNGNKSELRPHIAIDRYFWLYNKQIALQFTYSYPVHQFSEDHLFSNEEKYNLYAPMTHSFSFRLIYNLAPQVRYNPTKMSEL